MIWAVLHHHFGSHDTCDDWCTWLQNKDNPEALKKLQGERHHTLPTNSCLDEALLGLLHEWHINKCESLNTFIIKFVWKNKALMHLAISLFTG
jgi:hypothetical protein